MKIMSTEKKYRVSQYNIEGEQLEVFLGPLEANVIEAVWTSKKKPVSVREIYETLKKQTKIAYTTIMSTMNRLYEKGLLDRRIERGKGGLYYVYWPKLEKQNFQKSAVREVISSLLKNFGEIVTSCLIEESATSEEELKALREQLDKILKEKRK